MVVSFIGGGNRSTWKNHRPAASHWQTLSYNVVHLAINGIWTHNISGDKHRFDLDHDGSELVKEDMGVNEHDIISNITLRHKFR